MTIQGNIAKSDKIKRAVAETGAVPARLQMCLLIWEWQGPLDLASAGFAPYPPPHTAPPVEYSGKQSGSPRQVGANMPGDDLATWSTYASSRKVALWP